MDGRMDGWMDGWTDEGMDGWADGWIDDRLLTSPTNSSAVFSIHIKSIPSPVCNWPHYVIRSGEKDLITSTDHVA